MVFLFCRFQRDDDPHDDVDHQADSENDEQRHKDPDQRKIDFRVLGDTAAYAADDLLAAAPVKPALPIGSRSGFLVRETAARFPELAGAADDRV